MTHVDGQRAKPGESLIAPRKPKRRPTYAYRITEVTGSMVGRVEVGEVLLDYRHFGRTYTWLVFDITEGKTTGTFTGDYLGRAEYTKRGKITVASRKRLGMVPS